MDINPQKITLDVNRDMCFQILTVKQGDRGSRFIEITLTADGIKLELANIATKTVFSASLKGVLVQNDSFDINQDNNTVKVNLSDNALANSGMLECELTAVNDKNEKVTSATFNVYVASSAKGLYHSVVDMLKGIIYTDMLQDKSVTYSKLADKVIDSSKLADGAINRIELFGLDFLRQYQFMPITSKSFAGVIPSDLYDTLTETGVYNLSSSAGEREMVVVYKLSELYLVQTRYLTDKILFRGFGESEEWGEWIDLTDKGDFICLGELVDIKRLDFVLGQNNYDKSKVYRFSFKDDITIQDFVIPGKTEYIGYVEDKENYGIAIVFESLISDGIKRVIGFEPYTPGVYLDYWEELQTTADQNFDPESKNAQSGKAVAEAVEPKLNADLSLIPLTNALGGNYPNTYIYVYDTSTKRGSKASIETLRLRLGGGASTCPIEFADHFGSLDALKNYEFIPNKIYLVRLIGYMPKGLSDFGYSFVKYDESKREEEYIYRYLNCVSLFSNKYANIDLLTDEVTVTDNTSRIENIETTLDGLEDFLASI